MQKQRDNGQTILLVDDEEHLRVTVRDFLSFHGYRVELACNGEEALKLLPSLKPDLIILDISMPGMGGVGFLQRLVGDDAKPPPVLVLTARANLQSFFDGLDVAGFVSKPCEKGVLLGEVQRILGVDAYPHAESASEGVVHVLLGEDDEEVSAILQRLLKRNGHHVTLVTTGPGVLDAVVTAKADIVLIKKYLTRLNGASVATLLRAMPSARHLPVVLYDIVGLGLPTGLSHREQISGVDRYVEAQDCSEILDAVESVIARRHA